MKKLLISVVLFTFCFVSVAQKVFTAATFDGLLNEYKKDSKAFFINRLSADFRYTNPEGVFVSRKAIISGDAQKIVKTEILEPVIFQSGNLAVISGIHKTEKIGTDGTSVISQVACTYTFQRRTNKWMFVASQQNMIVKK